MAHPLRLTERRVGRGCKCGEHVATMSRVRQRVTHPIHKVSVCPEHGEMDRDVNAAANIAARAVSRVVKARATREKNRKLRPQGQLKTPPVRASLKYPGRDRTKNKPTQKRKNRHQVSKEVILPSYPARAQATSLEAKGTSGPGCTGYPGDQKKGGIQTRKRSPQYGGGYAALFDTLRS